MCCHKQTSTGVVEAERMEVLCKLCKSMQRAVSAVEGRRVREGEA